MTKDLGTIRREAWPIRVPMATFKRFKKAMEAISSIGWLALGSDRKDRVQLGTVADQALVLLEEKIAAAQKERR